MSMMLKYKYSKLGKITFGDYFNFFKSVICKSKFLYLLAEMQCLYLIVWENQNWKMKL